jgi:twitching motility protein PilT
LERNNLPSDSAYPVDLKIILTTVKEKGGSDLHLMAGSPPIARIYGSLVELGYPPMGPQNIEVMLYQILQPFQEKKLKKNLELDFSFSIPGVARFRGNAMYQQGSLAVVFRVIPYDIPELSMLGLPETIKRLCFLPRGLVLVTGPTGSGKTTTLAAMIDLINRQLRKSIVTIEDPIEFLHKQKKSTIRQREVGTDTHSYAAALRHILRQDPDVILIGEMRDLESISAVLTAAETGHLVFSTLHTQTAPLTVSRIVDAFQDHNRAQIRLQLANTLQAVISQQLLPKADAGGKVAGVELMINTPAVRNMIREGKEHQLYSVIQTGRKDGMQTMDMSLADLFKKGKITRETALQYCIEKNELVRLMQTQNFVTTFERRKDNWW